MSEWLDMGDHASFIWLSYGVTIGALLILGFLAWRRHKRLKALIERLKNDKKQESDG